MQISVVIPTYNEAENLPGLVSALFSLPLAGLRILIVDDNSPDGTGDLADQLADQNPGCLAVLHRKQKSGLGKAYLSGFNLALDEGADIVVQMDADFSHPPDKVVELVLALDTVDVAYGSRYVPGGNVDERWPLWRKSLSSFGNMYARTILRMPVRDATGGFRAWRRTALSKMPLKRVKSDGYAFQVEMAYLAHRLGYRYTEIPFYFADRRWGRSKMSFSIQMEAARRVWQLPREYHDI